MKLRSLTFALFALVALSCDKDDEKPSKTQLLTNGSTKSWNVTAESPADEDEDCRPSSAHNADNSWNFSKDGSFTYDHGTLTEGTQCSDLINLTGNWSFQENGSRLLITISQATDNPSLTFDNETLLSAEIKSLSATSMTLVMNGQEATYTAK